MFSKEQIEEAIEKSLAEMKGTLKSMSIFEQECCIALLRLFGVSVLQGLCNQELYNRKGEYDE